MGRSNCGTEIGSRKILNLSKISQQCRNAGRGNFPNMSLLSSCSPVGWYTRRNQLILTWPKDACSSIISREPKIGSLTLGSVAIDSLFRMSASAGLISMIRLSELAHKGCIRWSQSFNDSKPIDQGVWSREGGSQTKQSRRHARLSRHHRHELPSQEA